ncbi:5'-methylthioadenosine/adenosylhomocysteine nucleosidase [Mycolicibacterium komossense]|uniref:adenosylhomocysteine nucleosidase n=1 Tax=Mycolicibacterium komossense TaxID=1779 RepID=A0ABT3CD27_9MYCO|nr:5'-methylthioadenosine/adenosylhomocysteine nucleosidase [Mycolicibacterium komossense]MCV7227383.1 5'-methylthioadenosine/adenosylhomocysteine nucleosidase [Mycolicibacterium komossense]
MIGLICAIPEELAHLRDVLTDVTTVEVARLRFDEGVLDGHQVVLVGAGMGKVNAGIVTTLLAQRFGCRVIVLSGVAGGLDPALHIGDVVIADRVIQHDVGRIENEQLLMYQAGHVAFINPTDELGYRMAPDILARIRAHLDVVTLPSLAAAAGGRDRPPHIAYGTVLTGDQYLHCESTRDRLHRDTAALAIEMEGGAVAQVCEVFGVPWVIIRALSDLAGRDSAVDFGAFAEGVAAVSAGLVRQLLPVL